MQSASTSNGPTEKLQVEEPALVDPVVSPDDLEKHFTLESVSISLKYYSRSCECFSDWDSRDLKKFSATLEKISNYAAEQLQKTKPLCDSHRGPPSRERFKRPSVISEDVQFFELKVDPGNKARVHGFFVRSVFFLVWLDRKHQCFEQ